MGDRGIGAGRLGWLVLLPVLVAAQFAQDDEGPPLIPRDSLPSPFVRTAPLGVEELAEGFGASQEVFDLGRRLFFDPVLSPAPLGLPAPRAINPSSASRTTASSPAASRATSRSATPPRS